MSEAKQRVWEVYPNAFAYKGTAAHWRILRGGGGLIREDVIGGPSPTEREAWEDAASRRPQVETPEIEALKAENARLRAALQRLADCDWVITLPDRMDGVREIARAAIYYKEEDKHG